jgi:hypothetical protein
MKLNRTLRRYINFICEQLTLAQLARIHCFDNILQFMNGFSRPRLGKSPRRSLRPSAFAVYPSDRFEIRIVAGRLIRNMRWTRARSRALASNYGPANRGSARPDQCRPLDKGRNARRGPRGARRSRGLAQLSQQFSSTPTASRSPRDHLAGYRAVLDAAVTPGTGWLGGERRCRSGRATCSPG